MSSRIVDRPLPGLNASRRTVLKAAGAAGVLGLVPIAGACRAEAFAYEPCPTDDELETVVTSCAHNCGSRHMLVAHKKGNVIVRLSTDDGSYQGDPGGPTRSSSRSSAPACAAVPTASASIRPSGCSTR